MVDETSMRNKTQTVKKVNGMTDIDIMMEDEFNELERDYPRPHY